MGVVDVEGIDRFSVSGIVVLEQRNKPTRSDIWTYVEFRKPGDTEAGKAETPHRFSIVEPHVALHRPIEARFLLPLRPVERPCVEAAVYIESQAVVRIEVAGMIWRPIAGEIFGRGNDVLSRIEQTPRTQ